MQGRSIPPRILLFTVEPPHPGTAGGIVLHRLLQDYPPERLLVISNVQPPDDGHRLDCRYVHVTLTVDRLQRTRLWSWRNRLSAAGVAQLLPLGRVARAAASFRPDVVVALMQDSWAYTRAARLARRLQRPLLLLVHDLPHLFEPLTGSWRRRQHARDAAICRGAAALLCISEGMRQWFRTEYQVDGDVLLPPRSPSPVAADPANNAELKRPGTLSLGYAGGLHYGYGEQLLRLLPACRETATQLHVFSAPPAGNVAGLRDAVDVITFHDRTATPEQAWHQLLTCCDAMLQPYLDPPGAHALQYRTHFPSKLGDLLSLGLPLVVTGPRDASGVSWCRARPGSALLIDPPDQSSMRNALLELRCDGETRCALGRAAQGYAREFDIVPLRTRFLEHLHRLAPSVA